MGELTLEEVRERLDYDPETGVIMRRSSSKRWAGKPAGCKHKGHGYITLKIDQKSYLAHRIAWLLSYGAWPDGMLDHANLDRADNRLANLRPATYSENSMNQRARATNKCGLKGVMYKPQIKRWVANISIDREQVHLGTFMTAEDAHAAYAAAAKAHHGEFARAE